MSQFKPLEIYEFPRSKAEVTDDNLYWKKFGSSCVIKEYGAIDYIDFCSHEPHNVAVTCSNKVQIYNTVENTVHSSLRRFRETAFGGVYRKDGRLLIAGCEDGFLRLFEVRSHRLLRMYGHRKATHRCCFTKDGVHVVSFSDDKTVSLWDIPTEKRLKYFKGHKDYIRAGTVSEASQDIFVSGSYDHTVKVFDSRAESCVMTFDHGSPVESVLMFPSGGLIISAGGTHVKVWDPVAGRLLAQVSQHHKTITSLCFASGNRRLMSGSLDRHVKIYDVTSYQVVHTLSYPSPILSISVAPEDKFVAAGMTDGLISIRQQKKDVVKIPEKKKNAFYQYRFYGTDFKSSEGDIIIPENKKVLLKQYDVCFRKFESSKALDTALQPNTQKYYPQVTVSVLMELMRRGSIKAAMAGREGNSLAKLLKFVAKYIGDPRFMRILVDIGLILIELYGPSFKDPETRVKFEPFLKAVENQVNYMKKMLEIQGILHSVMVSTFSEDRLSSNKNVTS